MRTLWRPLLFCGGVVASVLVYLTLLSILARGATTAAPSIIPAAALAMCVLALNFLFLKRDGKSLGAIGLEMSLSRVREFAVAFAMGLMLVGVWVAVVALVGHAQWERTGGGSLITVAAMCVFVLFNNGAEELAYRAWLFLDLERRAGRWFAILLPSIVFAAAHVQGGFPWQTALTGVFTSGVLYATLFDRTRSVPLAAGFHIANNVGQELLGLRATAASLVAPRFDNKPTELQGILILLVIAALNVVLVVLISRRRPVRQG